MFIFIGPFPVKLTIVYVFKKFFLLISISINIVDFYLNRSFNNFLNMWPNS